MEPQNLRFGGGSAATLLHPIVAVGILLAVGLMLFRDQKRIIVPLLLAIFFIPKGQVVVIAGAHFTAAKILILTGLIRLTISRRSLTPRGGFNSIDRAFVLWALCYPMVFTLQWMDSQALVKSLGDMLDTLGGYFVLRSAIETRDDVRRTIRVLALIAVVSAVCMINEQVTGSNIFGRLGGMPNTTVRDGKVRSQAAFEVFITAGAYGATLMPLLVWLWSDGKSRVLTFVGMVGATVMTVTCYASTTLVSYAAGIFALCLWPVRRRMRLLSWGALLTLVGLHFIMNGPVWSLIEKLDLTGSSSSYHRYKLVDNCIRHFGDWWLLGFRDYNNWGWDMWDLSNQYVAYAVTGGLATLVLFISIIYFSFRSLGSATKLVAGKRGEEWFLWCLGAAVFAHVVSYFGIGYFDQMQFGWFALLVVICVAVSEVTRSHLQQRKSTGSVCHTPDVFESTYQLNANWEISEMHQ